MPKHVKAPDKFVDVIEAGTFRAAITAHDAVTAQFTSLAAAVYLVAAFLARVFPLHFVIVFSFFWVAHCDFLRHLCWVALNLNRLPRLFFLLMLLLLPLIVFMFHF